MRIKKETYLCRDCSNTGRTNDKGMFDILNIGLPSMNCRKCNKEFDTGRKLFSSYSRKEKLHYARLKLVFLPLYALYFLVTAVFSLYVVSYAFYYLTGTDFFKITFEMDGMEVIDQKIATVYIIGIIHVIFFEVFKVIKLEREFKKLPTQTPDSKSA